MNLPRYFLDWRYIRPRAVDRPQYEWVTAQQHVSCVDNQHPGRYRTELFERWVKEGWEIQSVMTLPPTSSLDMCIAVGLLKRKRERE
jgi:hypothetical protein